jgi:dsRNA-specific ribonuclease
MEQQKQIYQGIRGQQFLDKIKSILSKRGKLKEKYFDLIFDDNNIKLYNIAFTHKSADPIYNYEFLETLGDATANCSIIWYLSRRFPQINCPDGVKILARLKILYVSKKKFQELAKKLNLWDFVTCDMKTRTTDMNKTLEDVFESFIGVTQKILDESIRKGVGNAICYNIIKSLFDEISISLEYNDLFDSKTILKEIVDGFKDKLGQISYESRQDPETSLFSVNVLRSVSGNKQLIGIGNSENPLIAEEEAIKSAISYITPKEFVDLFKGKYDKVKLEKAVFDGSARKYIARVYKLSNPETIIIGTGSGYKLFDAEQNAAKKAIANLKEQGFEKPVLDVYKRMCNQVI